MKKIWWLVCLLTIGFAGGAWYLLTHPPEEDMFDALPKAEIFDMLPAAEIFDAPPPAEMSEETPLPSPELTPAPTEEVTLFIGDEFGGTLQRQVHEIDVQQNLIQKMRTTMQSLIQPTPDFRNPVIPEQTELLEVFLTNSGVVYLNFNRHLQDRHIGGLSAELATVAAIVNTMLVNFQEIRQVQILVEGSEIETLAGHVDCRKPFSKMLLLNS